MRHLWIEAELNHLARLIASLDAHLPHSIETPQDAEHADSTGLLDQAENTIGLGLVACQTYLAQVYGSLKIEKNRALGFGPKHAGGLTKTQLINHAANYWKHSNEWAIEKTTGRQEAIKNAFTSVGFPVNTDYPLSGVLSELVAPHPASLQRVIPVLEEWKAELYSAA